MPNNNFFAKTVPRVEVDHRVREARRRFDRVERLFVARAAGRHPWLRRLPRLGAQARRGNRPGASDGSASYMAEVRDDIGEVELTSPQSLYVVLGLCCASSAGA